MGRDGMEAGWMDGAGNDDGVGECGDGDGDGVDGDGWIASLSTCSYE